MNSSDNSSVSSILSDCNYDDSILESDISIVNNESLKEELKSRTFSSDSENENNDREDDELNSSRQENLYWCKCTHCTVMPIFIQCRCCIEFQGLLGDKLENLTLLSISRCLLL